MGHDGAWWNKAKLCRLPEGLLLLDMKQTEWGRLEKRARPWPRWKGVRITQWGLDLDREACTWLHPIQGLKLLEACPGQPLAYTSHLKSNHFHQHLYFLRIMKLVLLHKSVHFLIRFQPPPSFFGDGESGPQAFEESR